MLRKVQLNGEQSGDENDGSLLAHNGCSEDVEGNAKMRSARDVVTPLAHLPYAHQLEQKKNSLVHMLKKLVSHILSFFLFPGLPFVHFDEEKPSNRGESLILFMSD